MAAPCTPSPFLAVIAQRVQMTTPIEELKKSRSDLVTLFSRREISGAFPGSYTEIMDHYFRRSLQESKAGQSLFREKKPFAFVAVGGYGRRDLCLHSDIDVIILFNAKIPSLAKKLAADAFYPLWDAGLDLGHGIRSVKDCLMLSKEDFEVLTSMMDARFVCGDSPLYLFLVQALQKKVVSKKAKAFNRWLEEQDEIRAQSTRFATSRSEQSRIYLFSEIADILKEPKGHIDTAARPMTRKEERGMVWLGVEYQAMNADLARALNADGSTRGGARGLLVTLVYEGSPAERLGIKVGDILLAIQVPGPAAEIDLVEPSERSFSVSTGPHPRLWRSRRNYLTAVLTLLGEGREVRLHLQQGDQTNVMPVTLEKAPDDFDSADRYEDQALGLTVHHITYEVRNVLRLSDSAPGVVVGKVEPGSRAAVSRIFTYELITQVNGEPVSSPKEFEQRLQEASRRESIELLVQDLGQSRIVEINLAGGMP